MERSVPRGIIVALVTPMHDNGDLDHGELGRQVDRMVAAGVHGIFCLGTTGEFYALDYGEKLAVIRTVVERCAGRLPVIAGTGCVTTRESLLLTREARAAGADAVSLAAPYFLKASAAELEEHFRTIARSTDLPVLLYNIPDRSGNPIHHEMVFAMADLSNLVGVKESSGSFDAILRYLTGGHRTLRVYCGTDSLVLPTLLAGGAGAVSGIANVFPGIMVDIYDAWSRGDQAAAMRAQMRIQPLREVMRSANSNSVIKRATNLAGQPVGPSREPVSGVGNAALDSALHRALREVSGG